MVWGIGCVFWLVVRFLGDRVACGDYIFFLFCHAGGFGACDAACCLFVMGKQCACGATRGWRGDRVACGDYMLFLFCHAEAPSVLHIVG